MVTILIIQIRNIDYLSCNEYVLLVLLVCSLCNFYGNRNCKKRCCDSEVDSHVELGFDHCPLVKAEVGGWGCRPTNVGIDVMILKNEKGMASSTGYHMLNHIVKASFLYIILRCYRLG